jgi:hypothetical protein
LYLSLEDEILDDSEKKKLIKVEVIEHSLLWTLAGHKKKLARVLNAITRD